jgi:uncharacterized protein YjbI with pentapeptide repeats
MTALRAWLAAAAVVAICILESPDASGSSCEYSETPSAPPARGAVLWLPAEYPGQPNTLVLSFGDHFTDVGQCIGPTQSPWTISMAPGVALVFYGADDDSNALVSPWGAVNVPKPGSGPIKIAGETGPTWDATSSVAVMDPAVVLGSYGSCRQCDLSNAKVVLPGDPNSINPPVSDFGGQVTGANLRGATFTGNGNSYDFSGSDISGAAFTGTSLWRAKFGQVKADGTTFAGADLQNAQFTAMQFQTPPSFAGATFGGASRWISCTSISNTNLLDVSFAGTAWASNGCTGALFPGSQVPLSALGQLLATDKAKDVDLTGAQVVASGADRKALAGADLSGVNLAGVNFLGEPLDLTGTHFDGATLTQANLALARLTGATFENVNAAGASFRDADLSGDGTNPAANFAGTNLKGANFVNANISGGSFVGADLTGAVFTGARGLGTDFSGVRARNAVFSGAHVYGNGQAFDNATDLENVDFSGAVLAGDPSESGGFDFTKADLTGARFYGAVCAGCNLTNATLDQASFTGAYLPGAVLSGATLSGTSLDRAWLYCGIANDGCISGPDAAPAWPLVLGSGEAYGPVPFGATDLTGVSLADVTACPDGKAGSSLPAGCDGHLLPDPTGAPPIPAPCSASAHGACPTATTTVVDASTFGNPWAIVATAPPSWNTLLSGEGYYAAFDDGTIRLAGAGPITTIAGTPGNHCKTAAATCGDGGSATSAPLGTPKGLAVGLDGSLYIADPVLLRVRRIDPSGIITTVAGTGVACTATAPGKCGDNGPAIDATLAGANGVWVDTHGVLIIADGLRGVRRVSVDGTLTTLAAAGTESYSSVQGVVEGLDGMIYATTRGPDSIIQIDPTTGTATPVVGTGTSGYNGNCCDSDGNLLPGTQVQVNGPVGLSVDLDGHILFADTGNALIRAYVPSTTYVIDDLAGSVVNGLPQAGFNGDGLCGTDTELLEPWGVTATRGALLVVADSGNRRIREMGPCPVSTSMASVVAPRWRYRAVRDGSGPAVGSR